MSFWKNVAKVASGGLYNPGGGPKMPKMPGEKKQHKEVVGKSRQAGGAQINYNAEEMVDDVAGKPSHVIGPRPKGVSGKQQMINKMKSQASDYLQSQASGAGWRSEAAKKLLSQFGSSSSTASDGGGTKWM